MWKKLKLSSFWFEYLANQNSISFEWKPQERKKTNQENETERINNENWLINICNKQKKNHYRQIKKEIMIDNNENYKLFNCFDNNKIDPKKTD